MGCILFWIQCRSQCANSSLERVSKSGGLHKLGARHPLSAREFQIYAVSCFQTATVSSTSDVLLLENALAWWCPNLMAWREVCCWAGEILCSITEPVLWTEQVRGCLCCLVPPISPEEQLRSAQVHYSASSLWFLCYGGSIPIDFQINFFFLGAQFNKFALLFGLWCYFPCDQHKAFPLISSTTGLQTLRLFSPSLLIKSWARAEAQLRLRSRGQFQSCNSGIQPAQLTCFTQARIFPGIFRWNQGISRLFNEY